MKHAYLYFALAFAPWAAADGPRDPTRPPQPKTQLAVFRPSSADWFVQAADLSTAQLQFGAVGDVPVARDYEGIGQTEIYRRGGSSEAGSTRVGADPAASRLAPARPRCT